MGPPRHSIHFILLGRLADHWTEAGASARVADDSISIPVREFIAVHRGFRIKSLEMRTLIAYLILIDVFLKPGFNNLQRHVGYSAFCSRTSAQRGEKTN